MRNYFKTGLLVIGLFTSGNLFSQSKPIRYRDMLEIKSAVTTKNKIYLVGSVPHLENLKSYPVIVCTNLEGDTLWTKEYTGFEYGAAFEKLILIDQDLYISGFVAENSYSRISTLFKFSDKGEFIKSAFLRDRIISTLAWNGTNLYVTGVYQLADNSSSYILRCDRNLKEDTLITFWKDTWGDGLENRNIQFVKSTLWLSGTNETKDRGGYSIVRFNEDLKELSSFYTDKKSKSRCYQMITDKSNNVWTCGDLKPKPEEKTHFLYVVKFNQHGDTVYSWKQQMGTRYFSVTNLFETTSGEVVLVTKINKVCQLFRFHEGKFYKTESLEKWGDILPVQILEPQRGEVKLLGMELVGMGYGKSTFFPLELAD